MSRASKPVKQVVLALILIMLAACANQPVGPASSTSSATLPEATVIPTSTLEATLEASPTTLPTASATYPPEGIGPSNFPEGVDPLTGLSVANPGLLNRRPLMIKVANIPRYVRPQWGLMLADHVYEYYTEYGSTRFIAIYLGRDATQVGPIRSARFFDENIIQAYKAVFAFGSADAAVIKQLFNADYVDRLVLESDWTPLFRYDPKGYDFLMVDTGKLSKYISDKKVENGRQNLDGMFFKPGLPSGGEPGNLVTVRYSISIYNKWEYDSATGKYLRSSDTQEDAYGGRDEVYKPLIDQLTNERIAFDNVVFLAIPYQWYRHTPEQFIVPFIGTGDAYIFRDGQMFRLKWKRLTQQDMPTLVNADGSLFPFKPGTTWFEVVGSSSSLTQTSDGWRFEFHIP